MTDNIFKDLMRKNKELQDIFTNLPETIVIGAVGATGPSGGNIPPEKKWTLSLTLEAWREKNGEINIIPLHVSKELEHDELKALQDKISAESIVAFRGKLAISNPFGTPRAILISLLPVKNDPELTEFLNEYTKPVQITDSQFGTFTLDKSVDWFEGGATWCGQKIQLTLDIDDSGKPDRALDVARKLWSEMEDWKKKVDEYAVAKLLDLKNDNWLDEEENELTPQEFKNKMTLESISVHPAGNFEFWHDDGDLFWGHSIQICGSLDEGLTDADIPG